MYSNTATGLEHNCHSLEFTIRLRNVFTHSETRKCFIFAERQLLLKCLMTPLNRTVLQESRDSFSEWYLTHNLHNNCFGVFTNRTINITLYLNKSPVLSKLVDYCSYTAGISNLFCGFSWEFYTQFKYSAWEIKTRLLNTNNNGTNKKISLFLSRHYFLGR